MQKLIIINMTYAELQARKAELIRYIEDEVYNEQQLASFEAIVMELEGGMPRGNYPENYPFAPSKDGLKKIIEQVLEDDRMGLFITDEELTEEMKTW